MNAERQRVMSVFADAAARWLRQPYKQDSWGNLMIALKAYEDLFGRYPGLEEFGTTGTTLLGEPNVKDKARTR